MKQRQKSILRAETFMTYRNKKQTFSARTDRAWSNWLEKTILSILPPSYHISTWCSHPWTTAGGYPCLKDFFTLFPHPLWLGAGTLKIVSIWKIDIKNFITGIYTNTLPSHKRWAYYNWVSGAKKKEIPALQEPCPGSGLLIPCRWADRTLKHTL